MSGGLQVNLNFSGSMILKKKILKDFIPYKHTGYVKMVSPIVAPPNPQAMT
jgi:hypothetical protein